MAYRPAHARRKWMGIAALFGSAAFALGPASSRAADPMIPLIDLGAGTYFGLQGGLYENGSNDLPPDHAARGLAAQAAVTPLETNGLPSPTGKIVLLSIGASVQSQEWCGSHRLCTAARPESFMGLAAASPAVNHDTLVIVNGADSGLPAGTWTMMTPKMTSKTYGMVETQRLAPLGLTPAQVQILWIENANPVATVSLPASSADAFNLKARFGATMRAAKLKYPNLRQVFFSSRVYGGYGTGGSAEPYAYENAFAVKWLIQAQIDQLRTGTVDPIAGDLNPQTVAAWVGWSAYTWASGTTPRSDGLMWLKTDFDSRDGIHLVKAGAAKAAQQLMNFFTASAFTACWFRAQGCPS